MNYGFQYRAPEKQDYKQNGRLQLGGLPLRSDGQWDAYLPPDELQDSYLPTMACVTFATNNCVEILERQEFGDTTNWSDRFLAKVSGTSPSGNDPFTVAETLRRKGNVYEEDWAYTSAINTWEKFYFDIPYSLITDAQVKFRGKYDYGHQYVGTDPTSMMQALHYSPLTADVYAWLPTGIDGLYRRHGYASNHCICIYGYEEGQYWKCLDTYDNTRKKLAWDFGFTMVTQYTLHLQVLNNSPWAKAIRWLAQFIPNLH